jgi:hypothetical protein
VAKDRELNHLKEVYSGIENVTINDLESNIDSVINFMPRYRRSIEVQEILDQFSSDELNDSIKKYLLAFNDKMLERRARFVRENTRMPYEPLDITGKIARIDPETGETSCLFPKSQLKPTKPKMVTLGNSRSPTYFEKSVFSTNTIYPDSHPSPEPYITSSQRKTRALEADVELTALEWDSINEGWEDE